MVANLRDVDFLEYRFDPASTESLWLARQLVEQWLIDRRVRGDRVPDLLLATTEVCTSAVRHHPGELSLKVWLDDGDVFIEVEENDGGDGAEYGDLDGAGGDLRLAAALVDEVILRVDSGRTSVRCVARALVLP